MEKLKDNKKLLIGICVAIVVILVAIICAVVAKPSYKKQIKEFTAAMEDGDKMKKFAEKYVNYRAWYAMEKLDEDENLDTKDSKAVKKAFEKAYKNAKKSDYESDETKDRVNTMLSMYTLYTAMAGEDKKDIKFEVKDIGKLENGEENYSYMKQATFTMKITAGGESNESKWKALFYKGKFVLAMPDEETDTDSGDEYDFDSGDYDVDTEWDYEE